MDEWINEWVSEWKICSGKNLVWVLDKMVHVWLKLESHVGTMVGQAEWGMAHQIYLEERQLLPHAIEGVDLS